MRISLCVIGRLRAGPERDLVDDYIDRFEKTGRNMGLGPVTELELDAKGGGQKAEAQLLANSIPKGAFICAMDERGKSPTSPEFASLLEKWRDEGRQNLSFVIGGADGLTPDFRATCDYKLSFGKMVWPHAFARVMLAEQLYRAASILAGSPYHRN